MKLTEIPGWNRGAKITWSGSRGNYIYLSQETGLWQGFTYNITELDAFKNDKFVPYKEPKKRYWIWKIKLKEANDEPWCQDNVYRDNDGYDTGGIQKIFWNDLEKIKTEDDYIEI